MTRLILWRHGQTEWNAGNRIQGQTDIGLSEVGRAQARDSAQRLAELRPEVLFSSDLNRAAETMAELAALVGRPMTLDARLRERNFGDWEGLTHPEIAQRWPEGFARWRAGQSVDGAGVEDTETLTKRLSAAIDEIIAGAGPAASIVVATHGGAAKYATAALLGWPVSLAGTLGALNNCHRSEFAFSPTRGWQLRSHNLP